MHWRVKCAIEGVKKKKSRTTNECIIQTDTRLLLKWQGFNAYKCIKKCALKRSLEWKWIIEATFNVLRGVSSSAARTWFYVLVNFNGQLFLKWVFICNCNDKLTLDLWIIKAILLSSLPIKILECEEKQCWSTKERQK